MCWAVPPSSCNRQIGIQKPRKAGNRRDGSNPLKWVLTPPSVLLVATAFYDVTNAVPAGGPAGTHFREYRSMQKNQTRWKIFETAAGVRDAAVQAIVQEAAQAIARRGRFVIVLAGGSTPREVYRELRGIVTDWSKWHVHYGDERCLPPHHAERNSRMAEEAWLGHVPIPAQQIHPIPAQCGPEEGAARYSRLLAEVGEFDLVLLGLGEDGHTASLFPGNVLELDGAPAIPVRGAPKPPPERISLSASRLSRAHRVIFLATGAGKREAVRQWQEGVTIPAAAITPVQGADVFLDRACTQAAA